MKAAAIFGAAVFLIAWFLASNIYEPDTQLFMASIAVMGFCLMTAFGLAWWFP